MYRSKNVPFESEDCATATYKDKGRNFIEVLNTEYDIANGEFSNYKNGDYDTKTKAQCSFWQSGYC